MTKVEALDTLRNAVVSTRKFWLMTGTERNDAVYAEQDEALRVLSGEE